jgi:alpha-tubulin suppressor-like RCC1 family protein
MSVNLAYVDLGLADGDAAIFIAATKGHNTCILTAYAIVYCFGDDPEEMGENLYPVEFKISEDEYPLVISVGYTRVCALSNLGRLKCFDAGADEYVDVAATPVLGVLDVFIGFSYVCGIATFGKVKCWGGNDYGQLGYGHTDNIGDDSNEMGPNLRYVDLGLHLGEVPVSIALGFDHTCALTSAGRIKCWGGNDYGQLGYGHTGSVGDGPDEMGPNLAYVDLGLADGEAVVSIAAGSQYTCALTNTDRIKCWGGNDYGQLGYGHTGSVGDGPNEMGPNLAFVNLGLADREAVVSIAAGSQYTCALTNAGRVKCWGRGVEGQLGPGYMDSAGDDPGEMGSNLLSLPLSLDLVILSLRCGGGLCIDVSKSGIRGSSERGRRNHRPRRRPPLHPKRNRFQKIT